MEYDKFGAEFLPQGRSRCLLSKKISQAGFGEAVKKL
jgi:hypothetical protein